MKKLITSESVTEGHPDKICDQISDAILDECLSQDPNSRVAIECLVKSNNLVIAGELTTKANLNIEDIARTTLRDIGYTKLKYGIDADSCKITTIIEQQSPDISQGVTEGEGLHKEQGAGDQGMMYGYATDETEELMPLSIYLAHKLTKKLSELRKNNTIPYLRPDGKAQVSVEYDHSKPKRVDTIIISTQHDEEIDYEALKEDVIEHIIKPVCKKYIDENTKFLVNPTGKFIIGGPEGDAGVTGRKIIVDTYGGIGRHGGGAFSGKDPSKVDRSGAYATRHIAKSLVANKICKKCEVGISYAIGVAEPVSIFVDSFGTSELSEDELIELIKENFRLKPAEIISQFDLKKPIYKKTAAYGHFSNQELPWEKIKKISNYSLKG